MTHTYALKLRVVSVCLLVTTCLGFLGGCAHSGATATQRSAERRIEDYRLVSNDLTQHPMASLVQRDLTRAKTWLRRAETMLHDKDRDEETFKILLNVVEGQLIEVRSSLSRLEAQRRLEQERASYEKRVNALKSRRQATESTDKEQTK